MKIMKMALKWLCAIVASFVVTNASPIWTTTKITSNKDISNTQTRLSKLFALPQSLDSISLVPEESSKGTTSSTTGQDIPLTFGSAGSTLRHGDTTNGAGHDNLRVVRSVTSQEETTMAPVTTAAVKEETTEITTGAVSITSTLAPEVALDQVTLDNAYKTVKLVLARVQGEVEKLNVPSGFEILIDYQSRPALPENIVDNAKQCYKIQSMLRDIHKVVQDFISFTEGLTTLNGNISVRMTLQSLDYHILKLISPFYDYTPTVTPGTEEKNTEEVYTTLCALDRESNKIRDVVVHLKNC